MNQYICLNHGECNWADETPPREFSLSDGDDQACPNCESINIKEKPKPPSPPWSKVAGILGVILLIVALMWAFWTPSKHPLTLKATPDCQKGLITLITDGGDGSSIIYRVEGSEPVQDNNVFKIPKNLLSGSTLRFSAVQQGDTVNTECTIKCSNQDSSGTVEGPISEPHKPVSVVKWTRVVGSEFCVSNCVQTYNETDNLGHIRERKVENCAECQMDEK